ncbi:MAG TPA: phosphoribosylglycinamide formyltransferase [Puia sp.]|jgi:formyltetrahydrofolate-dependent phosphoribosylglycinamide formyltransferase|nr:phosphoribosylglycinamide formyltransferase [Puia sp.]
MAAESFITNIAIFASGTGSNTQKIIDHFRSNKKTKIALIVSNRPGSGVLQIAEKENIPFLVLGRDKFFRGNAYLDELKEKKINFIVLAGFLWKVPAALTEAYSGKMINLHPALLPKYGGKGMYGLRVHEEVIASGDKESGISIHYVDPLYDHGQLIFQAKCRVEETDTPESLAKKIQLLEHAHFPRIIEELTTSKI